MATTKKAYEKKNNERKVSVKYYLNTRLKPEITETGQELYPLYFQLLIKGKNTVNKSRVDDENAKFSIEKFRRLEEIINSETEIPFCHYMECKKFIRNNFADKSDHFNDYDYMSLFIILREKMLINKIVKDLRPFERNEFNINEFNIKFDIYNYKLKDSISKILKSNIQKLLTIEIRNESKGNAKSLFSIIDWVNANPYHIFKALSKQYPRINDLMKMFPYCFALIADDRLKIIPEKSDFIINQYGNDTYVNYYLEINSLTDEPISIEYFDILHDSIKIELKRLFSSQ